MQAGYSGNETFLVLPVCNIVYNWNNLTAIPFQEQQETGSSAGGRNKWNSPKYSNSKYRQEITSYSSAILATPTLHPLLMTTWELLPFPYYCQYGSSSSQVVGNKICVLPLFSVLTWTSLKGRAT